MWLTIANGKTKCTQNSESPARKNDRRRPLRAAFEIFLSPIFLSAPFAASPSDIDLTIDVDMAYDRESEYQMYPKPTEGDVRKEGRRRLCLRPPSFPPRAFLVPLGGLQRWLSSRFHSQDLDHVGN